MGNMLDSIRGVLSPFLIDSSLNFNSPSVSEVSNNSLITHGVKWNQETFLCDIIFQLSQLINQVK